MIARAALAMVCLLISCAAGSAAENLALRKAVRQPPYKVLVLGSSEGFLLDVGTPASGAGPNRLKVFQGDQEITPKVRIVPPIVQTIILFAGLEETQQCRAKAVLQAATSSFGAPVTAYTDVRNVVCPDFGIRYVAGDFDRLFDLGPRYARTLAIRVSRDGASGEAQARVSEAVWRQLEINASELSDPAAIVRKVTGFLQRNVSGAFAIISTAETTSRAPFKLVIYDGDAAKLSVSFASGAAFDRALILRIGIGIAVVLVPALIVIVWRRRARPVRSFVIGYGPDCDISLGDGASERLVVLNELRNKVLTIASLCQGDRVQVNGKFLKRPRRVGPDDEILIDGKRVKLSV